MDRNSKTIHESVQSQYASVARSSLSNDSTTVRSVAEAFGYSAEELQFLPPQANMGLSCGNPTATAALREGEVVVDLGCGGGLDVLLAAKRVGPSGKAIGIDMTPDMPAAFLRNAASACEPVVLTLGGLPTALPSVKPMIEFDASEYAASVQIYAVKSA